MKELSCVTKTLSELLAIKKYTIEKYYQREYMWQRKQIEELIEDLVSEFLEYYHDGDDRSAVDDYGIYFMGQITITKSNAIVDGQQRLTSLTLLLMYLSHRLQEIEEDDSTIQSMIRSVKYGESSYNIDIPERQECMESLYKQQNFETETNDDSIKNLCARYADIRELFPDNITNKILPFFCDWLTDKVSFSLTTAGTEQDAYKIFVTMNDRGLNLTSTEMLKGYLLSKIKNEKERDNFNNIWKDTVYKLKKFDDKGDETFIKAWLRAQYAETRREKNAGAEKEDFELIGGAFHKWVMDNPKTLGLRNKKNYVDFIEEFKKYAETYIKIQKASKKLDKSIEYVYYNAQVDFTQQTQLLLAPICPNDNEETINLKINIVARFIDLYIISRATNYRSLDHSTIRDYIFNLIKKIRRCTIDELKKILMSEYGELQYDPATALPNFQLNNKTKRYIKHILARIIGYIEESMGEHSKYEDYMDKEAKLNNKRDPFEVEHILHNHYEEYENEFTDKEDFVSWRNNIGALLLLRKSVNAALNDKPYEEKIKTYCGVKGNIYSASLAKQTYNMSDPRFRRFCQENKLSFESYDKFGKEEIRKRTRLLVELVKLVWNTDMFKY